MKVRAGDKTNPKQLRTVQKSWQRYLCRSRLLPSSCGAFALLLPVISVDGCGVGGKLGRGIIVRAVLIEDVLAGVQLLQKEKN